MNRAFLIAIPVSLLVLVFVTIVGILKGYARASDLPQDIKYGVTFSPSYAKSLNLDWKSIYLKTLDELNVKYIRIPTYWKDLEPEMGNFNFQDVDFMLDEAGKRGVKVLVVVGIKQPRWPECQPPNWAYELDLKKRQEKTLQIIEKVVNRYKNRAEVWGWQVENEPLFKFGVRCDPPNKKFLQKEVELVRSLDQTRSIILTDSGEWNNWIVPMQLSDVFGTTLYRVTYNKLFGFITYPLPPNFYTVKSNFMRRWFAKNNQKTIIAELQAEPWSPNSLIHTPLDEQISIFSLDDFKNNISYAKKTGFDEVYLWGVEWWFWIAQQGYPGYLEYAKSLF